MSSPNPLNKSSLSRAAIVGGVLAVLGIILFFALWIGFGQAGVEPAPRLFASLCLPPAVIAVLVGGYALWSRSRTRP